MMLFAESKVINTANRGSRLSFNTYSGLTSIENSGKQVISVLFKMPICSKTRNLHQKVNQCTASFIKKVLLPKQSTWAEPNGVTSNVAGLHAGASSLSQLRSVTNGLRTGSLSTNRIWNMCESLSHSKGHFCIWYYNDNDKDSQLGVAGRQTA